MKTIRIVSLKLTNFKGIRSLELNNLSQETSVYGENGTGKTSLFDAFIWLLFGKDSSDRKDFEIKTLDKSNNVIPKIDHEVEAVIDVNGERITLRRILREKWVKQKGALEAIFTGNETQYEWNGVPMNQSEFTSKINTIVDEKVFKMITNPAGFNSLKWQDQRDVLIDMSGNISDGDIAKGDSDFEALIFGLAGKSLDERKREVKASMTKSKAELKAIPTRIDEVERGKPETLDFVQIRKEIQNKEAELTAVNDQMTDELKAQQALIDKKVEIKNQVQKLEFEISDIKHSHKEKARDEFRKQNSGQSDINRQISEKEAQLMSAKNALETIKSQLNSKKLDLERVSQEVIGLRTKWEEINSEVIKLDQMDDCCPTCKQKLPEGDIEAKQKEMFGKLEADKQKRLDDINSSGMSKKETLQAFTAERDTFYTRIENSQTLIGQIEKELEELRSQISTDDAPKESEEEIYNKLLSNETRLQPLASEVQKLNDQLESVGNVNVDGLKETRDKLKTELQSLQNQLNVEKEIERHNQRIEELSKEERELAQVIANIEKELFTIEAFEKEKSTRIEESVNNRFQFVNFKLFETQINGGEIPTCKALINGVPFSDANKASKINAGLDIINTLCMHYKACAPIFIDNRESVIQLIHTDSQVINLKVSEGDQKLRVVNMDVQTEMA